MRLQVALIILDVTSGNIKQFTSLRNNSPGNLIYIISRSDHDFPLSLKLIPHVIPIATPIIIDTMSLCFSTKNSNLPIVTDFINLLSCISNNNVYYYMCNTVKKVTLMLSGKTFTRYLFEESLSESSRYSETLHISPDASYISLNSQIRY